LSLGILLLTVDLSAAVSKPTPPPEDTTIRILLIADNRVSVATINQAKSYLLAAWQGTNFSTNPKPTTITLANGGTPVFIGASVFTGNTDSQLGKLRNYVEVTQVPHIEPLRELHHADIVLGISSTIDDACGKAPQGTWTRTGPFPFLGPNFKGDPHDLREANDGYIGIARISGLAPCVPSTLAHEFGHLLGGGHWYSAHGTDGGLYENSRSWRQFQVYPLHLPPRWVMTAMVDGPTINFGCPLGPGGANECVYLQKYSDFDNPATNRNAEAFKKTARSVANYRSGVPEPVQPDTCSDGIDNDGDNLVDNADPQCSVCGEELCPTPPNPPSNCNATVRPVAMLGWVTQVCVPGTSRTEYQVVWAHACPQQVTHYEVWAAQPVTNPFTFRWAVVPPNTRGQVEGASARIKVKSCGVGGCSALSSASFLAVDLC
jgi:hypothetical protein